MDEGVVALATAGVGLIGAIGGAAIGGIAAARGARIGAETAARATVRQVHDQAAVDHGHWLRQQRLEAYGAMLIAYEEYGRAATVAQLFLERPESGVADPELGNVASRATAITRVYMKIRLLGPSAVKDKALRLRLKIDEHVESLGAWTEAARSADESGIQAAQSRAQALRGEIAQLYSEFLTVGADVLVTVESSATQVN
jgi:hypothetical protein